MTPITYDPFDQVQIRSGPSVKVEEFPRAFRILKNMG